MVYNITLSRTDRSFQLPYAYSLNPLKINGAFLNLQVVVKEEDIDSFEQELDYHPLVKRWRRTGGSQWPEITTTFRKARRRLPLS